MTIAEETTANIMAPAHEITTLKEELAMLKKKLADTEERSHQRWVNGRLATRRAETAEARIKECDFYMTNYRVKEARLVNAYENKVNRLLSRAETAEQDKETAEQEKEDIVADTGRKINDGVAAARAEMNKLLEQRAADIQKKCQDKYDVYIKKVIDMKETADKERNWSQGETIKTKKTLTEVQSQNYNLNKENELLKMRVHRLMQQQQQRQQPQQPPLHTATTPQPQAQLIRGYNPVPHQLAGYNPIPHQRPQPLLHTGNLQTRKSATPQPQNGQGQTANPQHLAKPLLHNSNSYLQTKYTAAPQMPQYHNQNSGLGYTDPTPSMGEDIQNGVRKDLKRKAPMAATGESPSHKRRKGNSEGAVVIDLSGDDDNNEVIAAAGSDVDAEGEVDEA